MITNFLLIFGIVMMVSGIFSYKQMKVTASVYDDLKKTGKLIVGERRFLVIFISEVVAFSIGKNDVVKKSVKVSGMLPFRKVKEIPLPYAGKKFSSLNPCQEGVDNITVKVVSNMIRRYVK